MGLYQEQIYNRLSNNALSDVMRLNKGSIFLGTTGLLAIIGIVVLAFAVISEGADNNENECQGNTLSDWPSSYRDMVGTYQTNQNPDKDFTGDLLCLDGTNLIYKRSDGTLGIHHPASTKCTPFTMCYLTYGDWYLDDQNKLHIILGYVPNGEFGWVDKEYYNSIADYSSDANGKYIIINNMTFTKISNYA